MPENIVWQCAAAVGGCTLGMVIMEICIMAKLYVERQKHSNTSINRGNFKICLLLSKG